MTRVDKKDNIELIRMRQNGFTLGQIGERFGITKERVRQRLVRSCGDTKIKGFLSTKELANICTISAAQVYNLTRDGKIKPVAGSNGKQLWNKRSVKAIQSLRVCSICGELLPLGKKTVCSEVCTRINKAKIFKRSTWRRFHRKIGQRITESIAYRRKGYEEDSPETRPNTI